MDKWHARGRGCAVARGTVPHVGRPPGSIPVDVIVMFHWHNPSDLTMALESTQPPAEVSSRNISCGVKAAAAYGWHLYYLHVPNVLKSGRLNLLDPSGSVPDCTGNALPFYFTFSGKELRTGNRGGRWTVDRCHCCTERFVVRLPGTCPVDCLTRYRWKAPT